MPPCLDVYALTRERNRACIDRFLARFVDHDRSRDGIGGELMVLPLGREDDEDSLPLAAWDYVQVSSLDEVIDLGLDVPCRAFRVYLPSSGPWKQAILSFTTDCRLIVGVSVDDPLGLPGPRSEASQLMADLVDLVDGEHGWVVAEEAPPLAPERKRPWEQPSAIDRWEG